MRSKTSWYNHEMMKQNFRQVGWISLVYFVTILLAVVLNILMKLDIEDAYYDIYFEQPLFQFSEVIQILMLFAAPVFMAMFILRYLHQKDASDFIHSLPITRSKLFWQQIGFGLVALWLPIVLNGILLGIIYNFLDVSHFFTINHLFYWLSLTIIILSFVFSVSIVIGMITGISIIQGIFTYVFLFFPVGFTTLVIFNLNFGMIGIPESYFIDDRIAHFSPITDLGNLFMFDKATTFKLVAYIVLTVILILFALLLYRKRPVEAASQAIAFKKLKPIFIYSFTFCFTLIGGFYFGFIQQAYQWIIIGYVIFSLIGYFVSQMIVQKSWRVFTTWREYGYFIIGFTCLILVILFDLTGFENRIPKTENIESVYVIDDMYGFVEREQLYGEEQGFTTLDDIEAVQKLHQELIDQADRGNFLYADRMGLTIRYQLKNGRTFVREYYITGDVADYPLLHNLMQTETYKKYSEPIFRIDEASAYKLTFTNNYDYKQLVISDREQVVELINRYREDILNLPIQEGGFMTEAEIHLSNQGSIYLNLTPKYEGVISWLEQEGLYNQVMLTIDDIETVIFAKFTEDYYNYSDEELFERVLPEQDKMTITDDDQLEFILDHMYGEYDEEEYMAAIYLKGNNFPYVFFSDSENVPSFVYEYFN
ncbi:DUF6449 domain-containing protein [Amphibacillus cookii]|uniref:DUF6449 domain-containing protein n=1 Tax=Amphibacillus cookii TaxID=767787 RepID=UPI00195AC217|nr:DUF6449 domain-containing protein [Amphibacillus cookii]MBM7540379.1 ABC-2 type transport system permease protein [Amphibacillus cookii]